MFKEKKIIVVLYLAVLPVLVGADQVTLSTGRTFSGAITGADDHAVSILVSDTQTVKIPHAYISSVFFRYADHVYLLSGEVIKCKVLDKKVTDLFIISEKGPQQLKISELKRYFYNDADSLFTPDLPPTGTVFNNQKSVGLMDTYLNKALFLSLSGGVISVPAQKWQENFITASSLLGLNGQIQAGFFLQRNFAVYGGFLLNRYKNTAENDLVSEILNRYIHLGALYSRAFDFLPDTGFLISVDAGLLYLSGNLYTYSYRYIDLDGTSAQVAGRILIGARTFIMKQVDIFIKTGYLFAKPFKLSVPAQSPYNIEISLSGWTILAGASLYLSL